MRELSERTKAEQEAGRRALERVSLINQFDRWYSEGKLEWLDSYTLLVRAPGGNVVLQEVETKPPMHCSTTLLTQVMLLLG